MITSFLMCTFQFQVKNEKVHFVWTRFSELISHFKNEAMDPDILTVKVAEMLSLLTCNKSENEKAGKCKATKEVKEILARIDARIRSLHAALPANSMLIVCTGHGDTEMVHRYILSL